MGDDRTKVRFKACAEQIIRGNGGEVRDGPWFEANGKFAHLHVWTDTDDQMRRIILDLQAEQVANLYSAEETDALIAEQFEAD
jgi:hypothetical protein